VVPCGLSIHSDPRLLEQIIRNLLSNALEYTKRGKVLLGCRRRKERLSIAFWIAMLAGVYRRVALLREVPRRCVLSHL